jgi:uncharacterized UPF0146 family protein
VADDPDVPEPPPPQFEPEAGPRSRERPLGSVAQKLIRVGAEAFTQGAERIRERGEDFSARDVLSGAAQLGARGKEEIITIAAQEVRGYLEKLRVGEELRSLLTEHSLEVSASIRLKPLVETGSLEADDVDVAATLERNED